jgi:hypothetical protein
MKYLKTFNEARLDYRKYAGLLTAMGHKNRGARMLDYAIEVEKEEEEKKRIQKEEEERKKLQETINEMSRFEPFNLIVSGSQEKVGRFYIMPSPEIDWFKDTLSDWLWDGMNYSLSIPFEFGIMMADKETEETFKDWNWSPEKYDGVSWPNRMYLSVINTNSPSFEGYDRDAFCFSTRVDAMRFKKMLVDLLEGNNDWYFKKWDPNGFVNRIKEVLSPEYINGLIGRMNYNNATLAENLGMSEEEVKENIGKISYQNVINSAKNIRINQIYKD